MPSTGVQTTRKSPSEPNPPRLAPSAPSGTPEAIRCIPNAALRPAFAFGGSCMPRDLRALANKGRAADLPSNRQQLERPFQRVVDADHRRIGVLGLAFKAGADDLRKSPMVDLAERLISKGYDQGQGL